MKNPASQLEGADPMLATPGRGASPAPRQFYWKGLHVPYIAPWSVETPLPGPLIRRHGRGVVGLGYADELPTIDRRNGALWARRAVCPGKGVPSLAGVHPRRQPQAMAHLLCQVCGHTTYDSLWDLWGERHLVLLRALRPGHVIAEGETTDSPPICLQCALESIEACPQIRQRWSAALVGYIQPWGVAGVPHDPDTLAPRPLIDGRLAPRPFGHEEYNWLVAARDIVSLHEVTPVDLHELAAEAAAAGLYDMAPSR
ncbi:hypothetical protein OG345_41720 (plasmid) [Streptomyces sp. NBC_01220]|uniref:hypothetical protein n=1 Tax=Streptomyces sp. NBC_01220 TaxID=2903781 RepID=UPI00352FCC11|nr:hypothetical protein OG345_41720 [Streptomyces sp. NBC_01220]